MLLPIHSNMLSDNNQPNCLHIEPEDRQNFREVRGALNRSETSSYVTGSTLRTREYDDIDIVTESTHDLRNCVQELSGIEARRSEKTDDYLRRVEEESDILDEVHARSRQSQTPDGYTFTESAFVVKLDHEGTEFDIVYDGGKEPRDSYIEL